MRLPTIQKGAAPRLVAPDPMAPVREAQARTAVFKDIGVNVQRFAANYTERENKRQVQQASLDISTADDEFNAAYGGAEEYQLTDIADSNFDSVVGDLGLPETASSVPSHKVFAEWRDTNYEEAIERASSGISNRRLRESFIAEQNQIRSRVYAQESVKANAQQIKYNAKQTMTAVDSLLLRRNYSGAREVIAKSELSEPRQAAAQTGITKRFQDDFFQRTLEKNELPTMEVALGNLLEDDEQTTSELGAAEQRGYAASLRSAIDTKKDSERSGAKAELKLLVDDAKRMEKDVWKGKPVDADKYKGAIVALQEVQPVLARQMEWAVKLQPEIGEFIRTPPSIQRRELAMAKKESKESPEKSYLYDKMKETADDGFDSRKTDTMEWGRETGLVAYKPLNYDSVDSLVASLSERISPAMVMQDRYGTFTGFLEIPELVELGSRIENVEDNQKLSYFDAINTAFGDKAGSLYEQLIKYDVGGTAPVAGQIASQGPSYRLVAKNILAGSRMRRDKQDIATQTYLKESSDRISSYIPEKLGNLYSGEAIKQGAIANAFIDLTAYTKDMDQAFNQLTGGIVDYKGVQVLAPTPGVSTRKYARTIRAWPSDVWSQPDNRVQGFTPNQLRDAVVGGILKQEGIGPGLSYLAYTDGKRVKNSHGVDFVFDFNKNEAISERTGHTSLEKEAKRLDEITRKVAAKGDKDIFEVMRARPLEREAEAIEEMLR